MKKAILLLLIMVISFHLSASLLQSDSIPQLTKQDYMQKSKRQLAGGIISLTGGLLSSGVGVYLIGASPLGLFYDWGNGNDPGETANKMVTTGSVFFLLGIAAITTGIFLFIASSKNKKRGLSITAGSQSIQQMNKSSVSQTIIPSVRLTIRL